MTRFNLTLQEGVDFVLTSLAKMWGGELFVPKIPSYRIVDLARAIAPDARHDVVGIRPGEKLHEEMITGTDALASVEFGTYYVILPSMSLWDTRRFAAETDTKPGRPCEYGFSYDSGTNSHFLSVGELRALIHQELGA
jgi:FlaA1/EpsC-like NDP-sugar epimerase